MGFFQGRYGFDFLSLFLLLLSSILSIWRATAFPGLILFVIVVYRTLSRNIYKRRNEDYIFRTFANKYLKRIGLTLPDSPVNSNLSGLFNNLNYKINQMRKYKAVTCPGCGKKLMLPRGRGKVIITCRTCKTEFKAKV